jgi:threonine dehydrogenase-like Zn-dependent dehydrogenase
VLDKAKTLTMLGTDRPHVVRETLKCCRCAGTVSTPGVYMGYLDEIPLGAFVGKGLTWKTGQTHVHKYLPTLMSKIESGAIDPSFIITHRARLDEAPEMYKTFRDKKDGCIKVVMTP